MPFDLQALAARRQRLLPDVWRAFRPGAQDQTPVLDDNGDVVPGTAEPVFEGPGMMSSPTATAQNALTTTDQAGVPNERVLKLGQDADLHPGDIVTCVSARWSPSLVGDTFVVIREEERSVALYRRFIVRGSSWLPG